MATNMCTPRGAPGGWIEIWATDLVDFALGMKEVESVFTRPVAFRGGSMVVLCMVVCQAVHTVRAEQGMVSAICSSVMVV